MKAPDKIYIEIDDKAHVYFGLQPENAEEYIRKDALMEFIEKQRSFIEGLFTEGDISFYDGQDDAYNNILSFIESL